MSGPEPPLVVDLDGSFLVADSYEILQLRTLVLRPHRFLGLRRLQARGQKDAVKLYLWQHGRIEVARLPVNEPLLAWIEEVRSGGRRVVLATGSAIGLAEAVAAAYPVFDDVMGTVTGRNLTGPTKAAALVEAFGERGFDYAGDSWADVAVWEHARRAILCNPPPGLADAVAGVCEVERTFVTDPARRAMSLAFRRGRGRPRTAPGTRCW